MNVVSPRGKVFLHRIPRRGTTRRRRRILRTGPPKEAQARELSRVARSSLGAVRRALALNPASLIPKWASSAAARDLLPAALVGQWNESSKADQALVASLAGRDYPEYSELLAYWASQADPPIRQIGEIWTVISRDDVWMHLAQYVRDKDLPPLEHAVLTACGEVDPRYDLPPSEQWRAALLDKHLEHSHVIREALAGTLAMLAALDKTSPLSTTLTAQQWADRVVRRLLESATTWQGWASLGGQLRYLAEASPAGQLDPMPAERPSTPAESGKGTATGAKGD